MVILLHVLMYLKKKIKGMFSFTHLSTCILCKPFSDIKIVGLNQSLFKKQKAFIPRTKRGAECAWSTDLSRIVVL